MNRQRTISLGVCLWAALLSLESLVHAAAPPDFKTIADRVVGQSLNIRQGDRVVLRGDARDLDLIEELGIATLKRGADYLQLISRERSALAFFEQVPAKIATPPLIIEEGLLDLHTATVAIEGQEFPGLLRDVAPERYSAVAQKFVRLGDARIKKGIRSVSIGNGLYPTEATARSFGMNKEQLAELFWAGIDVDYHALQATCEAIRTVLSKGKEVHVTHPNGTDLRFQITGRRVFVSDGVISPEDVASGGPAIQVYLPAGEVFLTPVPGTAEGRLKFDEIPFEGGELKNFVLVLKAGKLVSYEASPSPAYDRWKALYEAAPAGKEEFGFVDIGTNPRIVVPPNSRLRTWVARGSISLGTGFNTWAGGTVEAAFGAGGTMVGATLEVDGKPIVDGGKLVLH